MGIGLSSSILTAGSPNSGVGRPQRPAPLAQPPEGVREPRTRAPIKVTTEPVPEEPPTVSITETSPHTPPVSFPPTGVEAGAKVLRTGSLINLRA